MKLHTYIKCLAFATMSSTLTGCLFQQDDIFDQSPAERLETLKLRYYNELCQAENGWVMDYFPTEDSEGFPLLMKFSPTDAAVVASKNYLQPNYTEAVSMFEIIADNGPVLTFNTYNDVLHYFSNPEQPSGTGLEGDYEFMVINIDVEAGTAIMKGKKRGTYQHMRMLSKDEKWEDHLATYDAMGARLFANPAVSLKFVSGDDEAVASKTPENQKANVFQLLREGEDLPTYLPYIITQEGIRFHAPFERGGKESQYFTVNAENNRLQSVEDESVYFEAPLASDFLTTAGKSFKVDAEALSPALASMYEAMQAEFTSTYNGARDLEYVTVEFKAPEAIVGVKLKKTSLAKYTYVMSYDAATGEIAMDGSDLVMDNNASIFYNNVASLRNWLAQFDATMVASTQNAFTMQSVVLAPKDAADNYVTLKP